jgi:hypothetical protein
MIRSRDASLKALNRLSTDRGESPLTAMAGFDPGPCCTLLMHSHINFSLYPVNRKPSAEIQPIFENFRQSNGSQAGFSTNLLRIMCERHCAAASDLLDHRRWSESGAFSVRSNQSRICS